LEKMRHKIDSVVFVAVSLQEVELYESILPRYFPRSGSEADAALRVLPDSCWNTWGEVTVEERRIQISPLMLRREDEEEDRGESLFDDADRSFLDARDDADTAALKRLEGTMTEAEDAFQARQTCLRYLRKAYEMRPEAEHSRFVYRAGEDRFGRQMIVLLGAKLPALGIRDERTLPLFVKEVEAVRGQRLMLVYVNSAVSAMDSSTLEVLQEMLAVVSAMYSNSLEQTLVLHPRLWFRAAFALGRAVSDTAARVWDSTAYIENLIEVSEFCAVEQLRLPDYVHHWDMEGGGSVF
jgi:hypothetical protein